MIALDAHTKVYLARGHTDMRPCVSTCSHTVPV
jgi:hypothetical protein